MIKINLTFVLFPYNSSYSGKSKAMNLYSKKIHMELRKTRIALSAAAAIATGAQAQDAQAGEVSFNQWAQENPEAATMALNNRSVQQETAERVIEGRKTTQAQVAESLNPTNNEWRIGVQGSDNLRQLNSSFNYKNFGVGLQLTDTDNVEQYAFTAGLRFTPAQASALSRVLENGQIKVSLVESEVQNAIANFDETGAGFEFIFNLRNAILKQISVFHSDHDIDITDGSDQFRVSGQEIQSSVANTSTASTNTQTTTVTTTTSEVRNVAEDVTQTGIRALISLSKDLDVALAYTRDSLGESLTSAGFEYRINKGWFIKADYQETRRFSGNEVQDIASLTAHYNKGAFSAFAGVRDNGIGTEPYAGIQYRVNFGGVSQESSRSIASSLTSPVASATELHPHAISQETRSTENTSVSEQVNNIATGGISNITTTTDSCSLDFNVSDLDGVESVMVRLSTGEIQLFSTSSGTATFTGLTDNTTFGIELLATTQDGINGSSNQQLLASAQCTTPEIEPAISTPVIDTIGTWDITDNGGAGGIFASRFTITGSDIQQGAVFRILTPVRGLTIDSNTGVLTFDEDVSGMQSLAVTVQVTNTDGGTDTDTFTLNITDNL